MRAGKAGRREGERGRSLRFLLPLVFSLFPLASPLCGCAKRKATDDAAAIRKKAKDELPKAVGIGAGETTVFQSADPKSPISFTVGWTGGGFRIADGDVDTGKLRLPRGHLFQNGRPTSTYRADTGDAVRATKRLNMRDHVVVQSVDKTQTLTSDDGEYRGDVRIVRAIGHVVATGPFGTLSGSPELWATPDLKLIGTPDMVAKTLKIPALVALAATAAAGKPFFQGKDYTLENANGALASNNGPKGEQATFVPVKGRMLIITVLSKRLKISSAGPITVLRDSKSKQIVHMVSQGTVRTVQTSDAGTTTMDGDGSVYDAPVGAKTGTLDVGGRVTLVSETRSKDAKGAVTSQTTTSKGDKGRALLLVKPPEGGDALQDATLTGDVTIDSKGSDDDTFHGVGDRLVYTPHGATADADLTGHAVLTRTARSKDGEGKPTTQTVVGRGEAAHAVLDAKPTATAAGDRNPLKTATLSGGDVALDVSGSDGQTFKGTGDRVVYTATGGGTGRAVMTGDLRFSGDAPDYLSDVVGADTAVVTIGKAGWKTVDLKNANGDATTTGIQTKTPPSLKKPETTPGGKKKKGVKG